MSKFTSQQIHVHKFPPVTAPGELLSFDVSPINYPDSDSQGTNPGRFGPGSFRPGSFRPESFRPNFGVGRFGLGRWVDSALCRFGPGSFRPKFIPKCRLLRTGRQTRR